MDQVLTDDDRRFAADVIDDLDLDLNSDDDADVLEITGAWSTAMDFFEYLAFRIEPCLCDECAARRVAA